MRANIVLIALLVLGAALASCQDVESQPAYETPCTTDIEDSSYDNAYRAVLGFGEGAHAALRLALSDPGRFNVVVALDGPVDMRRLLADLEADLSAFDNWPETPSRDARLARWRDLLGAFGNPLYEDSTSAFYPPGLTAADFSPYEPQTLPGLISPDNPDGSLPTVTIKDASGVAVDFAVAHDLNGNGVRDEGEPVVMQLHEPFTDQNANGWYDIGEPYQDYGLDGVAGTDDTGEDNDTFDYHPRVADWLANDPLALAADASLDLTAGYRQSIYLDALQNNPWNYYTDIVALADLLAARLDGVDEATDEFCITNRLGRYDAFLSDIPALVDPLWFGEKYAFFDLPGGGDDPWSNAADTTRMARWSQALSFLSQRMPNGLYDNKPHESPADWQIYSFYSEALGRDVEFGVGYPAGYFDSSASWKSYPVVYVFHDRDSNISDWYELLVRQGDLANRLLTKQMLLIVVNGSRTLDDGRGFGYYVDQAGDELGGAYGEMVDELFNFVEGSFRVQVDDLSRDEEDDD